MSKDQNPSDKACDAYFDNPYAATSGSYYSDRVTFYAGFAAGAASRDAEVVSLTNQRDYEYVRAENAEQERDQLREQINVLRETLEKACIRIEEYGFDAGEHWKTGRNALASTPEQSLAEYRNKVIEECASVCDKRSMRKNDGNWTDFEWDSICGTNELAADEIRAMKE